MVWYFLGPLVLSSQVISPFWNRNIALVPHHHCIFKACNRLTAGRTASQWARPSLASISDLEVPKGGYAWHTHETKTRPVNPGSLRAEENEIINKTIPCSTPTVPQSTKATVKSLALVLRTVTGHWGIYSSQLWPMETSIQNDEAAYFN